MGKTAKNIVEIVRLHQAHLDIKENTPYTKRDGAECKAYHAWYDAAYVFFKSIKALHDSDDYKAFTIAEKDGNCFVLEHVYNSISPSYKVLMKQVEEMETAGV